MKTITALLALIITAQSHAETPVLNYRFNDSVTISIANIPCPNKSIAKEYPYGAVAKRIDGQYLFGCFKKENENDIRIQWIDGDTTLIPANYFLESTL